MRSSSWTLRDPIPRAIMKRCPDCCEDVDAEARKCRSCGCRFGKPGSTPPALQPLEAVASLAEALVDRIQASERLNRERREVQRGTDRIREVILGRAAP